VKNIAFLTSGGIAPCLSSCIVRLMFQYKKKFDNVNFVGYLNGYKGLLTNNKIFLKLPDKNKSDGIYEFGGSLIGNSRVKLTNINDCLDKGYIKKNEIPLKIAAEQLKKDKIDILHTIGGDDTNTTACDLSNFLKKNHYKLIVIGLPKTIDNDVIPINQTLGAITAAEQTAFFFENIVNENTTSSRHIIIHEVMGRNCGWLTAKSAHIYKKRLKSKKFFESVNLRKEAWDIHSVLIPEVEFNIEKESLRLKKIMDEFGCVNIFLSEGAGTNIIINEKLKNNIEIKKDAFGHYRLDELNTGKWFAKYFKSKLLADKVLVQKSGYFARSSSPNKEDLDLIFKLCDFAVESAILEKNGVIGEDIENENKLTCIDFNRIQGDRPFETSSKWFKEMSQDFES
tara:strand:+ start:89124 stop:90314 length:1191 start_codon:yes stop_codon:yes gene_type:complete